MAVAYSDFITAFPEFGNATTYPVATVNFWLTQAGNQLNVARFGTSLNLATMLFVAHNVVLAARATRAGALGGVVGMAEGPTTSKSVGGASVGYDVNLTAIPGAGPWNATSYGQRYYKMLQGFAVGPLYIPACRPALSY